MISKAPRQTSVIKVYEPMQMNRLLSYTRVVQLRQFQGQSSEATDRKLLDKAAFSLYEDLVGLEMKDEAEAIRHTNFVTEAKTAIIYPGATPGEQVVFDATIYSQNNNLQPGIDIEG